MIEGLLIPEFQEEGHKYFIKGKPASGTTDILNSCLGVNPFWTKEGRDAGKATHMAIHYYAEDDLDYSTLAEETKPRLDAYIKFCQEMNFKPNLIEQPLYSGKYFYCGTPDQVQLDFAVVDFKNGPHLRQHALQLASYAFMLPNPLLYERWGVHLREDGKYGIEVYKKQQLTSDFNVFLSCLNIVNWRKNGSSR